MCMTNEINCVCGRESISLHHGDSILPGEVIKAIYCPQCAGISFDPSTMIKDNDWIIEYDMEIAGVFAHKMRARKEELAPDFIFDNGYASWNGYTPNDIKAAAKEKMAMLELARTDKRKYMTEIKSWTENRLKRLADEGWRKAKSVLAAA